MNVRDCVLVDLGRSHVRAVATTDGSLDGPEHVSGSGAGLGDDGGVTAAAAVVASAVTAVRVRTGAGTVDGEWQLAVAAPGVATRPDLARSLGHALLVALDPAPAAVLLASDSAAWQVGAFDGRDGAVIALGTGAVVVARDQAHVTRLDGLGLLLGDVGGAAWTGRAALQRAAVAPGPLRDAAVSAFGPVTGWSSLGHRPDLAAHLAGFAPHVVALADGGDDDARGVLTAAALGVATTLAAVPAHLPLCVVGGFGPVLEPRLRDLLADRTFVAPAGDALTGLGHLLVDPGPFAAGTVRVVPGPTPAPGAHDTDGLPTEGLAADTADLDLRPTPALVARLVAGHEPALRAARAAVPALARAADLAGEALAGDGRLVYVGAGTPGRLALQDAAELLPTFGLDPARTVVLLAGGIAARGRAVENAEDDTAAGATDVDAAGVRERDVVVGVSASGRTPYVVAAVRRARERGAAVVGISGVPGSPLARAADVAVDLVTGPEVVAGSTRLAAGTAQKIALNTLSTAALIRAGKTFGPWMVDVRATNDKLRRRAVRIVRDAAGVDDAVATGTLEAAGGAVPVALVMLLAGLDAPTARDRLRTHGSVRAAVSA